MIVRRVVEGEGSRVEGHCLKACFTLPTLLTLLTLFTLYPSRLTAVETPPRFFDAEAHTSFSIPENWTVDPNFPKEPLFTWTTPEGKEAQLLYEPGEPIKRAHLQTELSTADLQNYAHQDLAARHPQARILVAEARTLSGRNAVEVTLAEETPEPVEQQSVYVFADDRFLILSLRAEKNTFPWQVPDFQKWLNDVQLLSRHESGALDSPAHGGLWVQRSAGVQITFPSQWLIGVADDRQVGATLADAEKHSEMTMTADLTVPKMPLEVDPQTKADGRSGLKSTGMTITSETEEPFHGNPAFKLTYEGYRKDRFVKGFDLYVTSPKARWLISVEGDGPLFNRLGDDYRKILDEFEFL